MSEPVWAPIKKMLLNVKLLYNHCSWINDFQFWLHIRDDQFWSFWEVQMLGPSFHKRIWKAILYKTSPFISDILPRVKTIHHLSARVYWNLPWWRRWACHCRKESQGWISVDKSTGPNTTFSVCHLEQVTSLLVKAHPFGSCCSYLTYEGLVGCLSFPWPDKLEREVLWHSPTMLHRMIDHPLSSFNCLKIQTLRFHLIPTLRPTLNFQQHLRGIVLVASLHPLGTIYHLVGLSGNRRMFPTTSQVRWEVPEP